MGLFDDVGNFFGTIEKAELTDTDKIQYVEDLLREGLRDLAFSRDEIYADSLRDNTTFMVRTGEEKIKKFKSGEQMYISIPASIYDELESMCDFDQYHHVLDTAMLTMAAQEYKEVDEDGNTNVIEAELVDNAVKKVESYNGETLPIADEIVRNEYDEPVSMKDDKEIFETKKYTAVKKDGEEEKDDDDKAAEDASASCDSEDGSSSTGTVNVQQINDDANQEKEDMKMIQMEQEYKAEYTSQSITDTEQEVVDDLKASRFYFGRYDSGGIIGPKEKVELNKYVQDIAKALRGYDGKVKRINPAKRLSSKDICNDISDKIYIGKDYVNGKFIDQNIVVDCSGSMGGDPIKDAIKLCYVFNKLAQEGLLEGHIILTESSENRCLEMPVHDDIISVLGGTGGGEGAYRTLSKYMPKLRGKNMVFMTDGDLVEEPIPNEFWSKNRINCVGMYINKSVKAENLPGYDKGMSRWFAKTIIRNSFDSAVQKLIQLGLRASKK